VLLVTDNRNIQILQYVYFEMGLSQRDMIPLLEESKIHWKVETILQTKENCNLGFFKEETLCIIDCSTPGFSLL
jgi:hypothetical protein